MGKPKPKDEFPPERIEAVLQGFHNLAEERSRAGSAIVFRRCELCGAEEYEDEKGRLKIDHHYATHHPEPQTTDLEIDVPRRAGGWGQDAPRSPAAVNREAVRARTLARVADAESRGTDPNHQERAPWER